MGGRCGRAVRVFIRVEIADTGKRVLLPGPSKRPEQEKELGFFVFHSGKWVLRPLPGQQPSRIDLEELGEFHEDFMGRGQCYARLDLGDCRGADAGFLR